MPSVLDLWFFILLAALWLLAYLVWMGPWLAGYRRTAGVMAAIRAGEARGLAWAALRLKGLKTALVLCVTSLVTGGWGLIEALAGIDPSALAPFQDTLVWKALLQDEMALRAASLAMLLSALLTLRGKLHDIAVPPQAGEPR